MFEFDSIINCHLMSKVHSGLFFSHALLKINVQDNSYNSVVSI